MRHWHGFFRDVERGNIACCKMVDDMTHRLVPTMSVQCQILEFRDSSKWSSGIIPKESNMDTSYYIMIFLDISWYFMLYHVISYIHVITCYHLLSHVNPSGLEDWDQRWQGLQDQVLQRWMTSQKLGNVGNAPAKIWKFGWKMMEMDVGIGIGYPII